jgi:hypothetical protein
VRDVACLGAETSFAEPGPDPQESANPPKPYKSRQAHLNEDTEDFRFSSLQYIISRSTKSSHTGDDGILPRCCYARLEYRIRLDI